MAIIAGYCKDFLYKQEEVVDNLLAVRGTKNSNPPNRRLIILAAGVIGGLAVLYLIFANSRSKTVPASVSHSISEPNAFSLESQEKVYSQYGGSASCRECHPEEYKLWADSHHGLAERLPTSSWDDAAFEPSRAVHFGAQTVSIRRTGASLYEVKEPGFTNGQQSFEIERVIGESPLRQFLVRFPGGRFQALQVSYDPRSNEWFNVFGNEDRRSGEWGDWTGRGMNWNSMCGTCHNIRLHKNYNQDGDFFQTTFAEQSVGCEACHGPLRAHNDWQKKFGKTSLRDPTLHKLSKERLTDNCGFCHARRGELTGDFKPGDDFLDQMRLQIVDGSDLFYADGQVHQEDYEYAAFLGSRMHQRGVQCIDCHNPHSGKTILPGNWLCMRCHDGNYTNAPAIQPVAHSHHKVFGYETTGVGTSRPHGYPEVGDETSPPLTNETGGECVNCHMPQTVYMQRHLRHDHGFTCPDPALTKEAGIPNACNRCHQDKNADWALQYCNDWYGTKLERPSRKRTHLLLAAVREEPAAAPALLDLLATNEIPYWRAVAAGFLGAWGNQSAVRQGLLSGLHDTNGLVRSECVRALEPLVSLPEVEAALRQTLADSTRAVRVASAWALRANLDLTSPVGKELLHCLTINSDQPLGQMQLGAFALARGDAMQAAQHYRKAVDWDPFSAGIRHDYAIVLSGLNQPQQAVEQMEEACRLEPNNAEFAYQLGLGWNELGRPNKTIESLQTAVRLDPRHSRAWYNLGLALNSEGRAAESLQALEQAQSANSSDPRYPYARATILAQLGKLAEARRAAQQALGIDPGFQPAQELMRNLP